MFYRIFTPGEKWIHDNRKLLGHWFDHKSPKHFRKEKVASADYATVRWSAISVGLLQIYGSQSEHHNECNQLYEMHIHL